MDITLTDRTCPGPCQDGEAKAGRYLCGVCWSELPRSTQQALYVRDDRSLARVLQLHRAVKDQVALKDIVIKWN